MRNFKHRAQTILLLASFTTLLVGLWAHFTGHSKQAEWIWLAGTLPVLVTLLYDILRAALQREQGLDILALLAIGGAIALGEPLTAAIIAVMLASGRSLESYAESRAQREMSALLSHAPRTAHRYERDQLIQIELNHIQLGDRLLVRTGESVPTDGTLIGTADLDESMLTGESILVHHSSGERVQSGVINAGSPFDMIATTTSENSTFAGIVKLVESAQRSKAPSTRLADRYALLFVPTSLAMAGLAWFMTSDPMRALAVLVVATPCPLLLAVPIAIVSGMSSCARRGVIIKNGGALEKLAYAKNLFFDKTGTLTGGHAKLVAIEADAQITSSEVLRLAASLDQASNHSIAETIVTAARERELALSMPTEVNEVPGQGIQGYLDGKQVVLGTFAYVTTTTPPASWSQKVLQQSGYEGASGVFVGVDGVMIGALLLSDEIRLETPRALRLLYSAGIRRIVMLTGDHRDVAETIASAIGVNEVMAEQTPSNKLSAIKEARKSGVTIMVGDGVNDAPALAAADIGVAMGGRGAAAASEAADVILMTDRLDRLAEAIHIAAQSRRIAIQSVVMGMGLSFGAMIAAAFGYLPPLSGAILQEVIDVAAILNALRVLKISLSHPRKTFPASEIKRLHAEHHALTPVLESISSLASRLPSLPKTTIATELNHLNTDLSTTLIPHEREDDASVYPIVSGMLGGEDPMSALSRTHREILHLARKLTKMSVDIPTEGPSSDVLHELQRTLYSLYAIAKLHFAQEEEIYHSLSE